MRDDWKELVRHVTPNPSSDKFKLDISLKDINAYIKDWPAIQERLELTTGNSGDSGISKEQWEKWMDSIPTNDKELEEQLRETIFEYMTAWLIQNKLLDEKEREKKQWTPDAPGATGRGYYR